MTIPTLRATVARDDLHDALKRLARCIGDRRNAIPILGAVMMRADPAAGVLRIYGTDTQRQACVTIPAHIEGTGPAVPQLAPLAAIVGKLQRGALVEIVGPANPQRATQGGANAECATHIVSGRFRCSLFGFPAEDFPMIPERAAAFSLTMPARQLLEILANAATDAVPAGMGDSKGAQLAFAADGLAVTAGTGKAMTRRTYPLPRLVAGDLAFRPKPGAPIVANFEPDAIKALRDAIAKPGAKDGDGPAVALGFAVEAGAVVAAMIDADGVRVTVKAGGEFPDLAPLLEAPRLEWLRLDAAQLAAGIDALAKGSDGKRVRFPVRSGPDGLLQLAAEGADDTAALVGTLGADASECEPVDLPAHIGKVAKAAGAGELVLQQIGGRFAGRGHFAIDLGGGAIVLLAGFAELPAERFKRVYGAAWAVRDKAAMAAAVSALREALPNGSNTALAVRVLADAVRRGRPAGSSFQHEAHAAFKRWRRFRSARAGYARRLPPRAYGVTPWQSLEASVIQARQTAVAIEADAPPVDLAPVMAADYARRLGQDVGEFHLQIARAIIAREPTGFAMIWNGSNPQLRAMWERFTGRKLPKGQDATRRAVYEWAGADLAADVAAETAARNERAAARDLADKRRAAEAVTVTMSDDRKVTGGAYVDERARDGWEFEDSPPVLHKDGRGVKLTKRGFGLIAKYARALYAAGGASALPEAPEAPETPQQHARPDEPENAEIVATRQPDAPAAAIEPDAEPADAPEAVEAAPEPAADDMAAALAQLLQRVAALEALASDASPEPAPALATNASTPDAVDWEAEWRAESLRADANAARADAAEREAKALRADLAAAMAARDAWAAEAERAAAKRGRTAARIAVMRRRADLDKRANISASRSWLECTEKLAAEQRAAQRLRVSLEAANAATAAHVATIAQLRQQMARASNPAAGLRWVRSSYDAERFQRMAS